MLRRPLLLLAAASLLAAPAVAAPRKAGAPLRAGDYVCQAKGAGMFPLTLLTGQRYKAAGPAGRYTVRAGMIRFSRGSLANQVGKLVSPTNFELAMDMRTPAYTTCNLAPKPS